MSNSTLGPSDTQEIQRAMAGLSGTRARAVAAEFSALYNVSVTHIYAITKDVRPARKKRSDHGRRAANLMEHPKLRLAAELVSNHGLKPELALEVVDPDEPDAIAPVSLSTFRSYLRQHGISRTQTQKNIVPYRSWSASAPGEIFQFDITGLKMRWLGDNKTRKMLYIDIDHKNHPDLDTTKERLWAFQIKDDYSKLSYRRFVATHKPNVTHVIGFLLEAYRELGVPLNLYTDNDAVIKNKHMDRAAAVLNRAFESSGGYQMKFSQPGNAKAHGLVENAHKIGEEFNRLIGVLYNTPGMAELNDFAAKCDARYNNHRHSTTGEAPALRFRDGHNVLRLAPPEILDSAFKAREFERVIKPNLTFEYDNRHWMLPQEHKYPFIQWAATGTRATFVWPANESYFVVWAKGYDEYILDRVEAVADAAGEFKSLPDTVAQTSKKALRASASDRKKRLVAQGKELLVPGFNLEMAGVSNDVVSFPRQTVEADADVLRDLPGAAAVMGRMLNKWHAISLLQDEEVFARPIDHADKAWMDNLFGDRETIDETELRQALADRPAAQPETNVVSIQRTA